MYIDEFGRTVAMPREEALRLGCLAYGLGRQKLGGPEDHILYDTDLIDLARDLFLGWLNSSPAVPDLPEKDEPHANFDRAEMMPSVRLPLKTATVRALGRVVRFWAEQPDETLLAGELALSEAIRAGPEGGESVFTVDELVWLKSLASEVRARINRRAARLEALAELFPDDPLPGNPSTTL